MKYGSRLLLAALLAVASPMVQAFDHDHRRWSEVLAKHVRVAADGRSSRVDYAAAIAADRAPFAAYLRSLAAVAAAPGGAVA